MILSLIQTSQERKFELSRFIESINNQIKIDFDIIQLIFIDQGNNLETLAKLNPKIELKYIKYKKCSLSHARNLGLQYVKGTFIGFPDDDCWYEPDTLYKVLEILQKNEYQGVSACGTNEQGVFTANFLRKKTALNHFNYYSAISYTMFFKFKKNICFDENMGVGSPYNLGSGEETDYMLTLMEKYNYNILYNPAIIVHHPIFEIYNYNILLNKSYSYARGTGYLLRKHKFPISVYVRIFLRPFIGVLVFLLQFNKYRAKKSFLLLKGRIEGFFYRVY